jgi:hypothetical protein
LVDAKTSISENGEIHFSVFQSPIVALRSFDKYHRNGVSRE